jgi:threonine dehydratase
LASYRGWHSGNLAITYLSLAWVTRECGWQCTQVVVEPSGAVGLAAVLHPTFNDLAGAGCNEVGVVLCGGNVDLDSLGLWAALAGPSKQQESPSPCKAL